MVKKRYFFIISFFIHWLLAISITQFPKNHNTIKQYFSVSLIDSPKKSAEKIEIIQKNTSRTLQYSKPKFEKKVSAIDRSSSDQFPSKNGTVAPAIMYNPAPSYPAVAKANSQEGVFLVKILVSPSGDVENIKISTIKGSLQLFEHELLTTIKTWKFSPGNKQMYFKVPISFLLDSNSDFRNPIRQ